MPHEGPTRHAPFLREYQSQVLLRLLAAVGVHRGETLTVLFPRQAGKNELQAAFVACLLIENMHSGGSIVVCAPTFAPQAEISVARLRRALEIAAPLIPAEGQPRFNGATVSLGGASVAFLSASPEAHVAGHTASLALIGDEAQEIDEDWFNRQFRPMAASTAAPTLLFGTPWDGHSLLDKAVERNRRHDERQRRLGRTFIPRHHQVSWQTVAEANPPYGTYVRSERARLGAAHPLYLTQYELVVSAEVGRLFTREELAALEGAHARLDGARPGERYVAGLDFGGEGAKSDATVLTIARVAGDRCEVVAHRSYRGWPFPRLEEALIEEARAWRLERVCADASGLGGPLCAHLEGRVGSHILERVTFTTGSKSEMGFALQAAARAGRLALYSPDDTADSTLCRRELRACRMQLIAGGRIQWEAPSGEHDDYVASLALCLRAAGGLGAPRFALGRSRAT